MAAPAPVEKIDDLLSAIDKSGLLSADSLTKLRDLATAHNNPEKLAQTLVADGTLTRWQADQLLLNLPRLLIGKYKLLDQLQASPTGRVYLAEHVQMGRRHALKLLARRLESNPDAVARFLKGAQQACGLDHKNVSHVYDVSQDRIGHYVVMEYVEGQTLQQLIEKSGPLKLPQAFDFLSQIADGLAHAHSHGVVHGDLNPANLVRDQSGVIKILEIGQEALVAKAEKVDADDSIDAAARAAILFQAPEIRGEREWADIACDVYSLGSVFCFLLTGKVAKDAQAATKHLQAVANLPPDVVAVCQRLMADNPSDRPRSMPAIVTDMVAAATPPAEHSPRTHIPKTAPVAVPPPPPAAAAPPPPPFVIETGSHRKSPSAINRASQKQSSAQSERLTPTVLAGAIGGVAALVVALAILVVCLLAFGRSDNRLVTAEQAKSQSADSAGSPPNGSESDTPPAAVSTDSAPPPTFAPQPFSEDKSPAALPRIDAASPPSPPENPNPAPATLPPTKTELSPEQPPKPTDPVETQIAALPAKQPDAAPHRNVKSNPFADFPKAISLPPLPESLDAATLEDLKPVSLGRCHLDDETQIAITLSGGETAIRAGKQKFDLRPRPMAHHEWDFVLHGTGSPVKVAVLKAKDNQLQFQWTEDAITQSAAARQLLNCVLHLGTSKQTVALRTPIKGQPLVFDLDKAGSAMKWSLRDLPLAKQIFLEVTSTEGFTRHRLEPKSPVSAGDSVVISTGPTEKSLPLLLRLNTSSSANSIDVRWQPSVKLEGWPEPRVYRRKDLLALELESMLLLTQTKNEYDTTKAKRPSLQSEKDAQRATVDRLARELTSLNTRIDQLHYVLEFSAKTEGTAKIHFRSYFLAGETKVELLRTDDEDASDK